MRGGRLTFEEMLTQASGMLRRQGRVSLRALKRQLGIDDACAADLRAELVDVLRLATDEGGGVLAWSGEHAAVAAQLETGAALAGAGRRQLTVMFCDLAGSTALSAQLDPEDLHAVLRAYQDIARAAIDRFGGFVAQYLGDGVLAYFGYPSAQEDDAKSAVHAGLRILEAMRELNAARPAGGKPLAVRIGVHTGPVVVGKLGDAQRREHLALGETPNVAARFQSAADPDSLLISGATHRLVQAAFVCTEHSPIRIEGRPEPVAAYSVLREREREAEGAETPIVGREAEAKLLMERWAQCKASQGQAVLLAGEAGIGKSRLVALLRERILADGGVRLTFRCSPYFTNSALHPVIEHLHRVLEIRREDPPEARLAKLERLLSGYRFTGERTSALFAALLSIPVPNDGKASLALSPQQLRQQTGEALTAWLLEEAGRHPLLVAIEDAHWADPSMLELLARLISQLTAARLMLVITHRPQFMPPWPAREHVSQLTLGRMSRAHVEALIAGMTRGKALPAEVLGHLIAKTDGVPIFVEELLKMVLESELLREEDGRYRLTGPLPAMAIPTTLQDSLMARLDRLAGAREIAQLGAVLGREFSWELIRAVAPMDEDALARGLAQLLEAELLQRRGPAHAPQYVFKHVLIRDTAYQSLLRARRSFYHDRIARVMEERFPEIGETQPELLAYHYAEAGLAEPAIGYLQRAAQRAIERSAYVEAINHLTRALELLKPLPATPQNAHLEFLLQNDLALAQRPLKGFTAPEVEATYARALELSARIGEEQDISVLLNGLWSFYLVRAKYGPARELGERMLHRAEKSGSALRLIEAHRAIGVTHLYPGELEAARAHLENGIALYDREPQRAVTYRSAGLDLGVSVRSFAGWGLWLLGYPALALRRCEEMLSIARDIAQPYSLAWALTWAARLHQYRREPEQARTHAEAAIALAK
jgi:class 3 adenylate cyclase/tetratricopeptide (TPR) repeat protein